MAKDTPNLKHEIWEQSKEWINAIGDVVNEMATKLGVASEHVYRVYTKQMFVEGIVYTSISILSIIMLAIIWRIIFVQVKKLTTDPEDYKNYDRSATTFTVIVGGLIFMVVSGIILGSAVIPNMMKIFNPEYYTMKALFDTVKGLVSK